MLVQACELLGIGRKRGRKPTKWAAAPQLGSWRATFSWELSGCRRIAHGLRDGACNGDLSTATAICGSAHLRSESLHKARYAGKQHRQGRSNHAVASARK